MCQWYFGALIMILWPLNNFAAGNLVVGEPNPVSSSSIVWGATIGSEVPLVPFPLAIEASLEYMVAPY